MSKKLWSVLAAGALVASLFSALPAKAAPEIPNEVQIDDPQGDANGLNDQDNAYDTPLQGEGDHVGPEGGTATDLLKVWFSNTASEISLHFQTAGNPANLVYDTYFRFASNPGTGSVANNETRGCLWWIASVNGAAGAYTDETQGTFEDECNVGEVVPGPLTIEEGPDGTFISTMTFPRSASPLLVDGGKITDPFGVSRIVYVGPSPTTATAVTLDTTQRGTEYEITGEGDVVSEPPVMEEPPVVQQPKKKNCKKIQNKKKRKKCIKRNKKLSQPQGCAAYVPGELGAEAEEETILVTDEATEEEPIEFELDFAPALGSTPTVEGQGLDTTDHILRNVQIDSNDAETGFWARLESPETDDPDLYVYWDNGTRAAVAGGFNQAPLPVLGLDGTGDGGHSGIGYEQIDGLRTVDCTGYTLDLVNWLGFGGTYTLKLWLGDIENDPAPRDEP